MEFARAEPLAFHFLELQDHSAYLDEESRALEMSVLLPLFQICCQFQETGIFRKDLAGDTIMAALWGALVGVFKAERTGYLQLGEHELDGSGTRAFKLFGSDPSSAKERIRCN